MSSDWSLARWNRGVSAADICVPEEYTAGLVSAKPRPDFAAHSGMKSPQSIAAEYFQEMLEGTPRLPGGKRRGVYRVRSLLFLLFEGKRKLERLILDGDAQHQLLRIFATFEPDGKNPQQLMLRIPIDR